MKALIFILVTLAVCSQISAVKLRSQISTHYTTIKKLRKISKETPIATGVMSTIELSLSSKNAQVDKIIKFVTDTLDAAAKKRDSLMKLRKAELRQKDKVILKVEKGIAGDKKTLMDTNKGIKKAKAKKEALTKKINSLKKDLISLAKRAVSLSKVRQADMKSFAKRQIRDGAAIKGLAKIIPMLQKLVIGKFVQKSQEEVKKALAEIPKGHPMEAFVELTNTLNPTKVKYVIKKLQGAKEALIVSKAKDAKAEKKAANKHAFLMKRLNKQASTKKSELRKNTKQLAIVDTKLDDLTEKRTNLKDSLKRNTKILAQKNAARKATKILFNNKIKDLVDTRKALKLALKVLTDGKKILKKMADTAGAV